MTLLEAVNHAHPGTVRRLALAPFPNSVPYGGAHVEVAEGASLPDEADLAGLIATYEDEQRAATLTAALKAHRWAVQNAGVTVGPVTVPTDSESRQVLTAMKVEALADPGFAVRDWTVGTAPVDLSNAEVIALSNAARDFVQRCFSAQAACLAGIAAGSYASAAEVVAAFDAAMAA